MSAAREAYLDSPAPALRIATARGAWLGGDWRWLALILLVAAALCLPFRHAIFAVTDEGVLLNGALRMLRGEKLYRDFFEFLPPGGFALVAGWFAAFGASLLAVRLLAALTVAAIAGFTFLACRRASGHAPLSALVAIVWLIASQGGWTQVSHHWFTTLFSMIAAASALRAEPARRPALIAGAAAGAAAMVTPTRGALTMLAAASAFLDPSRPARAIVYLIGCALASLAALAFLVGSVLGVDAWRDVIEWTAGRYSGVQAVSFGAFVNSQTIPLLFVFPAAALLLAGVIAQDWRKALRDAPLRVAAAFALAGFIGCWPRPDIVHIAFAAPLALPLLVGGATRLKLALSAPLRVALAGVAALLCVLSLSGYVAQARMNFAAPVEAIPRGEAKFVLRPVFAPLIRRIAQAPAADRFFFYPYMPMLPFLSQRPQVSRYEIFAPGYMPAAQYREACEAVARDADWIVIDRIAADPKTWLATFPAMKDASPPETRAFETALDAMSDSIERIGEFDLRRRRVDADASVCAGI